MSWREQDVMRSMRENSTRDEREVSAVIAATCFVLCVVLVLIAPVALHCGVGR